MKAWIANVPIATKLAIAHYLCTHRAFVEGLGLVSDASERTV